MLRVFFFKKQKKLDYAHMKIHSTKTVDTHNKDATKGSGAKSREIFIRITAFLNIRKIENNRLVPLQCKILTVWNSIPSYAFSMV